MLYQKPKGFWTNPKHQRWQQRWRFRFRSAWVWLKKELMNNKKVLLRERKRHTARRVVNTPSVVLTGYPPAGYPPARVHLPPRQGTPHQGTARQDTPGQGTPPPRVPPSRVPPQPGYPPGYPPARVPPRPGYPPWQGTPPPGPGRVPPRAALWHSGKCCKALWDMGTPPPSCPVAFWEMLQSIMGYGYPLCGQTDRHVSKHYLPVVLRTRAVTNHICWGILFDIEERKRNIRL